MVIEGRRWSCGFHRRSIPDPSPPFVLLFLSPDARRLMNFKVAVFLLFSLFGTNRGRVGVPVCNQCEV
jgi:hypothetical protein